MSILNTVIFGLLMGIIFGFLLEKSNVLEPGIIIGQFQFRKFIMLKVFLSAIVVGLIVFSTFYLLGFERLNWKTTIYAADVLGGLLLGTGIAIAGACPGTVFAQIGAGYKDSIATLLGALFGAITFIKLTPWFNETILSMGPQQKLTFDVLFNLPFYVVALFFVILLIALLYFLEKRFPWKNEMYF